MNDATQDIRYVKASDGIHLAYRVRGTGPIDLIEVNGGGALFSFDAADDQPRWRRFEARLGRFCRLIRFDARGIGASDPTRETPTVEQLAADAFTVLDAVGSEQAAVYATSWGGPIAIRMAVAQPERVRALILANSYARAMWAPDYPIGIPPEVAEQLSAIADPSVTNESDSDIDTMAQSIASDPEARRWWKRSAQRGAGPAAAAALWDFSLNVDVREFVEQVTTPTLLLRTIDNTFVPPMFSDWLAEHLADARVVDLPGADQVLWAGPGDIVVEEIEEFLTGVRTPSAGVGTFAAVLFTDIVDSTARNAAEGNTAWLARLERHDELVRAQLARFGGRVIKGTGDGVMATFSVPSLALGCALGIVNGAGELGLSVRAAVHAAEVETRDDDIFGLGVTIAARVLNECAGGEVLTTGTVTGLLAGSDIVFTARGVHSLKGVPGEWHLYSVAHAG